MPVLICHLDLTAFLKKLIEGLENLCPSEPAGAEPGVPPGDALAAQLSNFEQLRYLLIKRHEDI